MRYLLAGLFTIAAVLAGLYFFALLIWLVIGTLTERE